MRLDFIKTASFDYSAKQGVTFQVDVKIKHPDSSPVDVTGYSSSIVVYNDIDKSLIATINGTITDGPNGEIHFEHSAVNTALMPIGRWNYKLEMTTPTPVTTRLSEGFFEVNY